MTSSWDMATQTVVGLHSGAHFTKYFSSQFKFGGNFILFSTRFYQRNRCQFCTFCRAVLSWHVRNVAIRLPVIGWWRHQMETFSALLALCAGNSPVAREFPSQRPVTRSFDVYFDLHLNKRLSKQSIRRLFDKPSYLLWRQCNGISCTTRRSFHRIWVVSKKLLGKRSPVWVQDVWRMRRS